MSYEPTSSSSSLSGRLQEDQHAWSESADREHRKTLEEFHRIAIDLPWSMVTERSGEKEQQRQTVNQYSTLPMAMDAPDHRASLLKDIQDDIEKIPSYLTKHDPSFRQLVDHISNKQCARKIALIIYRLLLLNTYHRLWTIYLRSGTGQLIEPWRVPIWPKDLKTLLLTLMPRTKEQRQNKHEIYRKFVCEQLHALDTQLMHYEGQLNVTANQFDGYTLHLQQTMETYVEQHLRPFRMKMEHQMELIRYDYHIRALKLDYLRHRPNQFQEQLMKNVCESRYMHEMSKQQHQYLIDQMNSYATASGQTFHCSPLKHSTVQKLETMENTELREQLLEQFKVIAEQARDHSFRLEMKYAEEEVKKYTSKYDEMMKKMSLFRRLAVDAAQPISFDLVQLILQRSEKISERIQCIYKYKAHSTLSP